MGDYFKDKYYDALEKAKALYDNESSSAYTLIACETIFPELVESEDERVRKAILKGLIDCKDAPDLEWSNFGGIDIDECIKWLEKQGKGGEE